MDNETTINKNAADNQHVFIIGSKGIPAAYGGFETFVEKLTANHISDNLCYHVACMGKGKNDYQHNGAHCFTVKVPNIGPAKAVYYDIAALRSCIRFCKHSSGIKHPVFYVLACRIGPFIGYFKKQIENLGGVLYVNPDGHEWMRRKWSPSIRKYWKLSEKLMVKHADLLICDSKNIEKYILDEYAGYNPKTTYISYGSDIEASVVQDDDDEYKEWLESKGLTIGNFYLAVGRFVPENNFELMIREFMKSDTKKDFAIMTTANDSFFAELERKLHFSDDRRIKFVGTVYKQELLKKIREDAYGYLHGHEVGGTNPSLLEALGSTKLNLLLNVGFNHEVGEDAALYWTVEDGSLAGLIEKADKMTSEQIYLLGEKAKNRIAEAYSWNMIVSQYEELFLDKK